MFTLNKTGTHPSAGLSLHSRGPLSPVPSAYRPTVVARQPCARTRRPPLPQRQPRQAGSVLQSWRLAPQRRDARLVVPAAPLKRRRGAPACTHALRHFEALRWLRRRRTGLGYLSGADWLHATSPTGHGVGRPVRGALSIKLPEARVSAALTVLGSAPCPQARVWQQLAHREGASRPGQRPGG